MEDYTERLVVGRLSRLDARTALTPHNDETDRDALRIERQSLQLRFDGLATLAADGVLPMDRVREESARLRGRMSEIDSLLVPARTSPVAAVLEADDIAAAWAGLEISQQREIVKSLMRVTILTSKRGAKGFDHNLRQIDWE